MSQNAVRRLRPYLFHGFKRSQGISLRRTFIPSNVVCQQQAKAAKDVTHDYEKRLGQLEAYKPKEEWHPRLSAESQPGKVSVRDFQQEYGSLEKDETDSDVRTVIGMWHWHCERSYIAHSCARRQSTISPHRRVQAGLS